MAINISTSQVTVPLGGNLAPRYSYDGTDPNQLAAIIEGHFRQTLLRDRTAATVQIVQGTSEWSAVLTPTAGSIDQLTGYVDAVRRFGELGQLALNHKQDLVDHGFWRTDKDADGHDVWRLYLPLGLAMVNQLGVQMLHYPPDYTLDNRDYLDADTCGFWEELLRANDVPVPELGRYESVVDLRPIAADGAIPPTQHVPITFFQDYVTGLLQLLLRPAAADGYTIPLVVGGADPCKFVNQVFGTKLVLPKPTKDTNPGPACQATIVTRQDGSSLTTWVLGMDHPCNFVEAVDRGFDGLAQQFLRQGLIAARWHVKMASDPSQAGNDVLDDAIGYWNAPERAAKMGQLYACLKCVIQHMPKRSHPPDPDKDHPPHAWQNARQSCVDAQTCLA